MEKITKEEYSAAVISLLELAQRDTGGSRMAAQVLLSAYNGDDYQLDVAGLGNLDRKNFELSMTVIRGRYDTGCEPHTLIQDGSKIFGEMWTRWMRLHVSERGKIECRECRGRGTFFVNPDDENDMETRPCTRCSGTGRVCGCH